MLSWLGKTKSVLPNATPLQSQRSLQIDTLKSFNKNVSEIRRDEEYRVNCNIGASAISLYITLPPQFPQEKPVISVSPPVYHPWVNDQMIITESPGIKNFSVHSDLGKVIHEIVDEFQRNAGNIFLNPSLHVGGARPPYPMSNPIPSYPMPNYMASVAPPTLPSRTAHTVTSTQHAQVPMYSSPGAYQMPEIPATFPQLQSLSVAELQEMTDDEEQMLKIIQRLPQLHQLSKDREDICQQNEQIAEINLSTKPFIEEKKEILLEKFELLNELRNQFDERSCKQDDLLDQFNSYTIQGNLKVAVQQSEEESEYIADNFLSGDLSVEEFLKKFLESRKVCHLRKAKEEKLSKGIIQGTAEF